MCIRDSDKTTGEVIRTIHNAPFHNAAAAKVKGTPNLKAVFMLSLIHILFFSDGQFLLLEGPVFLQIVTHGFRLFPVHEIGRASCRERV